MKSGDQWPASKEENNKDFSLVVMAASAGGLAALSLILATLPEDFPAAVAVVQHLDPHHHSLMPEILGKRSPMRVKQAQEGDRLKPGTVFIAPPDRHLLVNPNDSLSLSQSELVHFVRPSADLLFESAAASYKKRTIAVILSGTGQDGSLGIRAIKKMGGCVIAQDESTSEFFGMPEAAIHTGQVDFILPIKEIADTLVRLTHPKNKRLGMAIAENSKFEVLLEHLKRNRGFDFHGYKRSTLMRRVMKRMQSVGVSDYVEYLDTLEVHPEEFTQLFNTILINVTSFFRDGEAWEYLAKEVIPHMLAGKTPGDPLRVWSAGCASGEEVYSLVMLLVEAMGAVDFSRGVKIYATDADEEALNLARQGSYAEKDMHAIPAELRKKYFKRNGSQFLFRSDLRHAIVFGSHNLVQDAPISRLDLLICRNTLMYLNAETQDRILARFHFALNETGYLFLGKAEMLLTHTDLFTPAAIQYRIFTKNFPARMSQRLLGLAQMDNHEAGEHSGNEQQLRELAFEAGLSAQVVVDADGKLVLANEKARGLFRLSPKDLGQPLKDLELSYRPVELRSILERVSADLRPVKLSNVEGTQKGNDPQILDVEVRPLKEDGNALAGFSITYEDVSARQKAQAELQGSNLDLNALSEEIESAHEELETANEELQSTNEELQATNEEFETMNEELHSTNEELETLNDELRERTNETNRINAFLQSILSGLHSGVMVVDRQLKLLLWNRQAEELWGLRSEEVLGKSILNLDIGLPAEQVPLLPFLSGAEKYQELTLPATNRRGKAFQCHIICTPYLSVDGNRQGVVLLMEEK